ncbi:MAG: hypothetical protein FJ255_10700 [Phycisphaerae bacterium]|nr:hypothetical protein [Phycisphaerae bacterium]
MTRGTRRATTVRLGEQSCSSRRHDCAPSARLCSTGTTVPRAAQSWHPEPVSRLFGSANSRALPAGTTVPRRHDCAPSGTVVAPGTRATTVRLGEQSCSSRRHDCAPSARLCSTGTTVPRAAQSWHPEPVPRLFGSANSRARPAGTTVPHRHDCAQSGTVVAPGALRPRSSDSRHEVAAVLDVSRSTVEADWRMARAWLLRRLAATQA